jgi:glycerol-3-phosphate acyltransferase PlsY
MLLTAAILLAAYLIGAIPFGFVLAKALRGIDIRQYGSGNIGATNVGRVIGWPWFFVVFVLDFAKGAVPVWLAQQEFLASGPDGLAPQDLAALVGLAAIIGHMWPVYLGFRGGKGVATGVGVICTLAPIPTAVAVAVWGVTVLITRYVALGSVLAAVALAVTRFIETGRESFSTNHRSVTFLCLAGAVLVIVRHHSNIVRLLQGTESKLGQRSADERFPSPDTLPAKED